MGAESWARLPQVVAPPNRKEMQGHLLAPPREVICWGKKTKKTQKTHKNQNRRKMSLFIGLIRDNIQFRVVGHNVGALGYPAISPTSGSDVQEEKRCSTSRHDLGITGLDPTLFWCRQHRHTTSTLIPRDTMAAKQVIPLNQLVKEGCSAKSQA